MVTINPTVLIISGEETKNFHEVVEEIRNRNFEGRAQVRPFKTNEGKFDFTAIEVVEDPNGLLPKVEHRDVLVSQIMPLHAAYVITIFPSKDGELSAVFHGIHKGDNVFFKEASFSIEENIEVNDKDTDTITKEMVSLIAQTAERHLP